MSAVVKLSAGGICHPPDSSYYSRTRHFTPYVTLSDCMEQGGRLPVGYVAPPDVSDGYSRSRFGHGWSDADGDCQDARQEVLIAQSTAPVRFTGNDRCRVASGRWISPYSGRVIHNPGEMDVDHIVPLKWAWERGASRWSQAKREQFANDPRNLVSVEASLNREKGARGPDQWLPPANQQQYLARFRRVARAYGLDS